MTSSEQFQDWDQKIASAVQRAVDDLRRELLERLDQTRDELRRWALEDLEPGRRQAPLAADVSRDAGSPPAAAAAAPGAGPPVTPPVVAARDLKPLLSRLDQADSQEAVLDTLTEGAASLAPRAALFLTRRDAMLGWSSAGFAADEPPAREWKLTYDSGTAWADPALRQGVVRLTGRQAEELAGRLGVRAPAEGFLIPLVLRDRIAAALWVDRDNDAEPLDLPALQVLAYTAAQLLQTLPFRTRGAAATLRMNDEAPAEEAPLPLWGSAAPETTADLEPERREPPTVEPAAPGSRRLENERLMDVVSETPPEPAPELGIVPDAEPETLLEVGEELEVEAIEPPPSEPASEVAGAAGLETEVVETLYEEPPTEVWTLEDEAGEPEIAEPPPSPESDVEAAPEPETEAAPAEPATTPPPDGAPGPPPLVTDSEVKPPPDMEGPGSAFSGAALKAGSVEPTSDPEEARRLARLLVSEIKLYNEDAVEAGRASGDLYAQLADDIERSRRLYEDRVDPRVREDSDYFQEELVRILGDGDPEVLGG